MNPQPKGTKQTGFGFVLNQVFGELNQVFGRLNQFFGELNQLFGFRINWGE